MRQTDPIHRPATPEIGTQLANLYRSSHDLIDRFGLTPDLKTAWKKFEEEIEEFGLEELFMEIDSKRADSQHFVEEAADVLVTLFNVVRAAGVSESEFIAAIRDTWRKNDAKTFDTHYVDDKGLIARKGE